VSKKTSKIPRKTPGKHTKATPAQPHKKGKGLPVKRVTDVDKQEAARAILDTMKSDPLHGEPRQERSLDNLLPDGLTAEQREIARAGKETQALLAEADVFEAMHAMVNMRRGYVIAYREYLEVIERKKRLLEEKGERMSDLTGDFLVQYAMWQATKPFNEHEFMTFMLKTVMPWFGDVVDKHSADDARAAEEEREEFDKARRARPVPIGFRHTPLQGIQLLEKYRSLVLTGWRNAVEYLLDLAARTALAAERGAEQGGPFVVVRFMRTPPKDKTEERNLVRVAGKAWAGCADTEKAMAVCMGGYVLDRLTAQPDLLVCDHLPPAFTSGLVGRPEAAVAGDAHRRFRKWCDKAGAGFVGAVCFEDKQTPDTTEPAFEQLRTFTDLRAVQVLEEAEGLEPGKYRLVVGNWAEVLDVGRETLDAYGHGSVLLPRGVDVIERG
jgi:hypothetical protein